MAVKVTVVERFKQESMNELFVYWDEKGGRSREAAVSGGSTVLYSFIIWL